ncbi:MAG TPA: uroporphyrinogen-III synthase [Longimicrobiales bacterium]|nr:uroporphyrinogen-III synthase [Longimicrobiales bacterium]
MRTLDQARIAVTRAAPQAEELVAPLRARGALVHVTPLIRVVPAPVEGELRETIKRMHQFDWVVFTSVNGVELFLNACAGRLTNPVACVGEATAASARSFGLDVRIVPDEYVGEAIAPALAQHGDLRDKRILLARAGGAGGALPQALQELGALVSDLEVYRSQPDETGARRLAELIAADDVDIITFTSSSTVRYFSEHAGTLGRAKAVVIGPVTEQTAIEHGIIVSAQADPHTTAGLVKAIEMLWREND